MLKSELITKISAKHPHLKKNEVELIINTMFNEIRQSLINGHRVELRRFGSFDIKKKPARIGRNPKTGEIIHIKERYAPFFKMGKALKDRLNEEYNKELKQKS
ncbi:integration host factor subunit beta [Bartonella sp. DGB1]|uniref:integration host factor subunit beta n=1 Tax=Bartonella sp. DGB1 TaxID=3239807 RepID=UPI0035268068